MSCIVLFSCSSGYPLPDCVTQQAGLQVLATRPSHKASAVGFPLLSAAARQKKCFSAIIRALATFRYLRFTMNDTLSITDNTEELRFETPIDSGFAFISYRWEHGKLALMHTEVPEESEGEGVAKELVKFAFEQAKQQQRKVIVFCPYISAYLNHHPEYKELVEKDYNAKYA